MSKRSLWHPLIAVRFCARAQFFALTHSLTNYSHSLSSDMMKFLAVLALATTAVSAAPAALEERTFGLCSKYWKWDLLSLKCVKDYSSIPTCNNQIWSWDKSCCVTPTCESYQKWDGQKCVENVPTCGSNYKYDYSKHCCVIVTPTCYNGQVLSSDKTKCVNPTCNSGWYFDSSAKCCVPTCKNGQILSSDKKSCVNPSCNSGYHWDSSAKCCVVTPPTCYHGQVLSSDKKSCVDPTCSSGWVYSKDSACCVKKQSSCSVGYKLVAFICIPDPYYVWSEASCALIHKAWNGKSCY